MITLNIEKLDAMFTHVAERSRLNPADGITVNMNFAHDIQYTLYQNAVVPHRVEADLLFTIADKHRANIVVAKEPLLITFPILPDSDDALIILLAQTIRAKMTKIADEYAKMYQPLDTSLALEQKLKDIFGN